MATLKGLLLVLLFPILVFADSTTIFTGTTYIDDSYIQKGGPTSNYGTVDSLRINNSFLAPEHAVIRLANIGDSIPAFSTVTSCTLSVYIIEHSASFGDPQIRYAKICKDWVESEVSYDTAKSTLAWQAAGINSGSGNFCDTCGTTDDMNGASDSYGAVTANGVIKLAIQTCQVQDWVDGVQGANGVKLYALSPSGNKIAFYSSEHAGNTPEWKITWTAAAASSGLTNNRHSLDGNSIRHSPDGNSTRHGG